MRRGARAVACVGHLAPAPDGVDAAAAWACGGDGAGITVADVELGWDLSHVDLAGCDVVLAGGESDPAWASHGTSVLGVIVGMVPRARVVVASQRRRGGAVDTVAAIDDAMRELTAGDVLLLQVQAWRGAREGLPAEALGAVFEAVRAATAKGVTVVEAAGNGAHALGAVSRAGRRWMHRDGPDFEDSGAVVVGAALPGVPHWRARGSNFGGRVDCFAWGDGIETLCAGPGNGRTRSFGGTSGAAAIVAGAAAAVQSMAAMALGRRLTPTELRAVLSDARWNTPSADPRDDQIGVMPDLARIVGDGLTRLSVRA